jgi:hypothetical protein
MKDSRLDDASRDGDLIDRWLDEGDRLSESAHASAAGITAQKRRRVAEVLGGLRALADRRRFSFMVGAVVVSAIAVVGLRALSHTIIEINRAAAVDFLSPLPRAALVASAPPSPPPVPVAATAPSPEPLTAASEPEPDPPRPAPAAVVPDAAARPAAASASDSLLECRAALRRERAKAALAACEKVASDNPASADALVLLAHAQLLAGWGGETLRLARRASFLDPKCADAYLLIGTVQQAAGRTPAARSAYESYLATAPHGSHAAEIRAILRTL